MSTFFGLVGSIAFFLLIAWIFLAIISGAFELIGYLLNPVLLISIGVASVVLAWLFS
jgi:hypothetical protein